MEENKIKGISVENVLKWIPVMFRWVFLIMGLAAVLNFLMDAKDVLFAKEEVSLLESEYGFDKAKVIRIMDGDTFTARIAGGEEFTVRMIGINTPENTDTENPELIKEGEIAANWTRAYLLDETVYLQYDEKKEDAEGQILAYVWIYGDCDPGNYEDFCMYNFGAILLQRTYCDAVYEEPNGMYREWFEKLDAEYQEY